MAYLGGEAFAARVVGENEEGIPRTEEIGTHCGLRILRNDLTMFACRSSSAIELIASATIANEINKLQRTRLFKAARWRE
jgi:hypothetical protein